MSSSNFRLSSADSLTNSTESIVVVEDTVDFDEDTVVVEVAVAVVVDSVVVEGGFLEIHTALT